MSSRDRAYWDDVFRSFFITNGFGKYEDAFDAFVKAYPDFAEFHVEYGKDHNRTSFTKRLASQFKEADRKETDSQPTPPHIRQVFLPFAIEVPPLSPSINAFDGQGRLGHMHATPKQHRRHHNELKKFHHGAFAYRQGCETAWTGFMEQVAVRLSDIEHPENLTFTEIVKLLSEHDGRVDDGDTQNAAPPL